MKNNVENAFSSSSLSDILEIAIDKSNTNSGILDVRKVQVEDEICRRFLGVENADNK